MDSLINEPKIAIALSLIFWLTPIALTIHLAIEKTESKAYKQKLGYVYGGLWASAFFGYGWMFLSGLI